MGHVVRMTVTGSLGITFMFAVDAANLFWVSLLGFEKLVAALGYAWTLQFFSVSFGMGMMIAVTAVVSRLIGQRKREDARRQTTVCAITTFLVQLLVAVVLLLFREKFLALAGAEGETLRNAARYLLISVPSLPIMALGMVGSAVLRAEGDAMRAMWVTFSSGVVSMIVDPLLIYGLGLGLDGAAVAVVLARIASALLSLYFLLKVHDLAGRITLADFRRLFPVFALTAIPAILTQLATPFGNYVVTSVIAQHGDSAVAGWAVVSRLTVLAFGGLFSLSAAIGGIFGQNYGALQIDRVRQTYKDALLFCAGYTLIVWSCLALGTGPILSAFRLSGEAASVVIAFTTLAAGAYLFNGALYVANAAFNSLGKAHLSTLFNWFRDGMILWPLAILLSGIYGAPGAIYGHALAGILGGLFACGAGWLFVSRLRENEAGEVRTR